MKLNAKPITEDHIAQMPDELTDSLTGCPRCGGRHPDLLFHRFHRPPPCGNILYWAHCPTTGEPILAFPK